MHAISIALAPDYRTHSTDPVVGDKVTMYVGLLQLKEIDDVGNLWHQAVDAIEQLDQPNWRPMLNLVSDWAYPQRASVAVPDDIYEQMREIARQMLLDIVRIGHTSSGLLHRAAELADELEIDLTWDPDSDFETLFPRIRWDGHGDWETQILAIRQLAERWIVEKPRNVVERINRLENEAKAIDERNRRTPFLADELAKRVTNPIEWVEALIQCDASGDLVVPFLQKASTTDAPQWVTIALDCLARDSFRYSTVAFVLGLIDPPSILIEQALRSLDGMSQQIEYQCARNAISESTTRSLLTHDDDAIASAAAIGVWVADPIGSVPSSFRDDWERAVPRGSRQEYQLGEIFKKYPSLGFEFLQKQIRSGEFFSFRHDHAAREALASISIEHRRQICLELPDEYMSRENVRLLIGDCVELFRELLSAPHLERFHTAPLHGRPINDNWVEKAKIALDAGMQTEEVADAAFGWYSNWKGNESDMWNGWISSFESIQSNADERICEVAEFALEVARNKRDDAAKRERTEAIYGRD